MNTVLQLLHDAVKRYPHRPYLMGREDEGWKAVSFSETEIRSDNLGAWFISRGYESGDRAVILSEGRPEWIIGELGLLKAAAIAVPISIQLLPEEIPFRVNHSGSRSILVSANLLAKVLACWKDFDQSPELILLTPPSEDQCKALEDLSLVRNRNWHLWDDIQQQGKTILEQQPRLVSERENSIALDHTITICYTSGTTGNPKGIMLSHGNYWSNVTASADGFGLPDGKFQTLVILPLDHSFAHTVAIYAGIYRGITLWFVDSRGGSASILRNIPRNLLEAQPDFLLTVPALSGNFMKKIREGVEAKGGFIASLFRRGLEAGSQLIGDGFRKPSLAARLRYGLVYRLARSLVFSAVKKKVFGSRIKFFVGGGAILEVKQQEFFASLGLPVYQGYGLTEATPVISANTPGLHKYGSSGAVLSNVECRICGEDGRELPPGNKGEIVIRGGNVMKGYYRNPEASAAALRDGWLYTGDLGFFDEDGFLYVVGREKALLINPSGEKYPPEEIEEALLNSSQLFAQVMAHCDNDSSVGVLLTLNEDACRQRFDRDKVTDALGAIKILEEEFSKCQDPELSGKSIPPMWKPRYFEIIPQAFSNEGGLVNSTMKLVRHKVVARYAERIQALYRDASNANPRNMEAVKQLFSL